MLRPAHPVIHDTPLISPIQRLRLGCPGSSGEEIDRFRSLGKGHDGVRPTAAVPATASGVVRARKVPGSRCRRRRVASTTRTGTVTESGGEGDRPRRIGPHRLTLRVTVACPRSRVLTIPTFATSPAAAGSPPDDVTFVGQIAAVFRRGRASVPAQKAARPLRIGYVINRRGLLVGTSLCAQID